MFGEDLIEAKTLQDAVKKRTTDDLTGGQHSDMDMDGIDIGKGRLTWSRFVYDAVNHQIEGERTEQLNLEKHQQVVFC